MSKKEKKYNNVFLMDNTMSIKTLEIKQSRQKQSWKIVEGK